MLMVRERNKVTSKRFWKVSQMRRIRTLPSSETGDDRGNTMIIAMAVLMIMGILAAAVWAKTISGLRMAGYDKVHLQTLAVADSGIDEATFRIEQLDPEDPSTLSISQLTGEGGMSGGAFQYEATRKSSHGWEITSVATVGSVRRAIRAEAVTMPKFGFGIQAKSAVTMNGNPGDFCSYDPNVPGFDPVCVPNLEEPIIGTSGTITCSGGGWNDVPVMLFPPGSGGNCQNMQESPTPYNWEPVVPPADNLGCPNGGNWNAGVVASLAPGNYVCNNLTLGVGSNEDLCTNPATIDMWSHIAVYVTGNLTFGRGMYLNVDDSSSRGCTNPPVGPPMGHPFTFWPTEQAGAFRVFVASTSEINIQQGTHLPAASMVLFAPNSWATANGGPNLRVFGSVMLDTFTNNGALDVVGYDRSLSLITTKTYKIVNWTEVPPPSGV